MTFVESVSTCFSKYADFDGRATRSEYWWWGLFCVLAPIAMGLVSEVGAGLFTLAILLPYIAVTTRRLHDTDRSGWLQLVGLIPLVGWILLIVWCTQEAKEPNRYGSSPDLSA